MTGAGQEIGTEPMRLDEITTIFRSIFEQGEAPFVSIDPVPEDPKGPVMNIRHGKGSALSYAGWILFETDRVMKILGLGRDNITRDKVSCSIEGYKNQFHKDFVTDELPDEVWERYWIVPASATRRTWEKHGARLALLDVPLEVRTQRMKMVDGKLEPAEDEAPTKAAAYFSQWFTSHYNDIARQWTSIPPEGNGMKKSVYIYDELRRIAQITAIAEYMREQGAAMPGWMRYYPIEPFAMPTQTPSLRLEDEPRENQAFSRVLYGGVDLAPETKKVTTQRDDKEVMEMGEKLERTFHRQSPPLLRPVEIAMPTKDDNLRRVTALALPGSETKAPGCLETANDDLVVMAGGQYSLRLKRHFNSFNLPSGEFGKGWTMDLPKLEKSKQVLSKEGDHVQYQAVYNLYSPLGHVNAVFAKERKIKGKGTFLVDDNFEEALGLGTMEDKRIGGKAQVVMFHDGRRWYFNEGGSLVGDCQGQFLISYKRDDQGRILKIAGFVGDTCVAEIRLAYDNQNRIQFARAGNGKAVRYSYAETGELRSMEVCRDVPEDLQKASMSFKAQGRLDYTYQNGLLASIELNETLLQRIEYDELGRVKKMQNTSEAEAVQQYEYRELEDGKVEAADSGTGIRTRYDEKMRPTLQVKQDGSLWDWSYPEQGGANVRIHTMEGEVISVTEDRGRQNYSLASTSGEKLEVSKSPDSGEVALKKNGQTIERAVVAPDGRPVEYSDAHGRALFEYDADGALKGISQAPVAREGKEEDGNWMRRLFGGLFGAGQGKEGEKNRGDWIETELDRWKRPASIQTGYGDKLQMIFDDLGWPTQIEDNGRHLEIQRNADGSLSRIKTNWGEEEKYQYDGNADLAQYTMTRDGGRFVVKMTASSDGKKNGGKSFDITDYRGNKTQLEIDEREEAIKIQYPDRTEARIRIIPEKAEIVVDSKQSRTRSIYDGNGNLVKVIHEAISK